MRVGLYVHEDRIDAEEVRKRFDPETEILFRLPDVWTDDQVEDIFSLVLIDGANRNAKFIFDAYTRFGTKAEYIGTAPKTEKKTTPNPVIENDGQLRVGFFEDPGVPYYPAMVEGIKANGDKCIEQNPYHWVPEGAIQFDVAIFTGAQPDDLERINYYRRKKTPIVLIELGHINRACSKSVSLEDKYFQMSIEHLTWLPHFACPSDRREKLGIEKPAKKQKKDGYILLLGQKPGDAQHDIDDMITWKKHQRAEIRKYTKRPILWRKHPADLNVLEQPREATLEEDFDGAFCVVTHNSNAGIKALLEGIPVCSAPSCFYNRVSFPIEAIENPRAPSKRPWEQLFNKICYAQWNIPEMRSGEAWGFMRKCLKELQLVS